MNALRRILAAVIGFALCVTLFSGCNGSKDNSETAADSPMIVFGKSTLQNGLSCDSGKNELKFGSILGKEYAKIKRGTELKFKIEDKYLKKLADKKLLIKFEYYESSSKSYKVTYHTAKGYNSQNVDMSETGAWGGYCCEFDDFKPSNDEEYDFSLSLNTASSMWLRSVTVAENKIVKGQYPKLLKTDYITSNGKVVDTSVCDFGAVGDGVADDSIAFQTAIRSLSGKGGVIYVPAGNYKLTQDIVIPSGVTLLGDFNRPTRENSRVGGTVIETYTTTVANGNTNNFISLCAGSCVKGLTVWYPEQTLDNGMATPYNYTFGIVNNDGTAIEDIYLVNSYNGISHKNGNAIHYQEMVKNVYGTPLRTGYLAGIASDSDRQQFFDFSPAFWLGSGLKNVPDGKTLKNWLMSYGVGFSLGDIDFHYVSDIAIEGYKVGMHVTRLYGRIYNFDITDCNVCMYVDNVAMYGGQLTNGNLKANGGENPVAMVVGESVENAFTGTNLNFESTGEYAIKYLGTGQMALQNSKISVTGKSSVSPIKVSDGKVSLMNTSFSGGKSDAEVEKNTDAVKIINCSSENGKISVSDKSDKKASVLDNKENVTVVLDAEKLKAADGLRQYQIKMPKKQKLYPVSEYGEITKGDEPVDISGAVQKAIDAAASDGGGVVYIPCGDYRLEKAITVKSGVELAGATDYFHSATKSQHNSVLLTDYGKGTPYAKPLISIEQDAGIRGFSIIYDIISQETIQPYATTIQGLGKNVYVINMSVIGGYYIADFNSHKCDNHYIESLNFFTFKTGIAVGGGSENGIVLNGHSNPGEMWSTGYNKNTFSGDWSGPLMTYLHKNANSYYFGKTKNQVAYMLATFGTQKGVKIDDGADVYIIGCGIDYSVNGIFVTGKANAVIIDPQCIGSNQSDDYMSDAIVADKSFGGTLNVYNLCAWNINDASVRIDGGSFSLNGGVFFQTAKAPVISKGGKLSLTGLIVYNRSLADVIAQNGTESVTVFGNILKYSPKFTVDSSVKKFGSDLNE